MRANQSPRGRHIDVHLVVVHRHATTQHHWNRSARVTSVQRMAIRLENVGIAVRDLDATIAFFTDLGSHRRGP